MSNVSMYTHKIVGESDIVRWPDGALRVTTYNPDEKYALPIKLQVHQSWNCVRHKLWFWLLPKSFEQRNKILSQDPPLDCQEKPTWTEKWSREKELFFRWQCNCLFSRSLPILFVPCTSDWSQSSDVVMVWLSSEARQLRASSVERMAASLASDTWASCDCTEAAEVTVAEVVSQLTKNSVILSFFFHLL